VLVKEENDDEEKARRRREEVVARLVPSLRASLSHRSPNSSAVIHKSFVDAAS